MKEDEKKPEIIYGDPINNLGIDSVKDHAKPVRYAIILLFILTTIQLISFFLSNDFPLKMRALNDGINFFLILIFLSLFYLKIQKPFWIIFIYSIFCGLGIFLSPAGFSILKLIAFALLLLLLLRSALRSLMLLLNKSF